MLRTVTLTLSGGELRRLGRLVAQGRYEDEKAALRAALQRLLQEGTDERERIAAAYERAYAEQPEEEWVGEAGARLMAERVKELEAQQD